jgi:homoserine kinase type II
MAIYTEITEAQISDFLGHYSIGELKSFSGILKGVSNTNYLLVTDLGKYIFTIFEPHRVQPATVDFFLQYALHLKNKGIPSPGVVLNKSGHLTIEIMGKPAAIVNFLEGEEINPNRITTKHCYMIGKLLGQLHLASYDFEGTQVNSYGFSVFDGWFKKIRPKLTSLNAQLENIIDTEIKFLSDVWPKDLPAGVIHGDLFPDNVFFNDETISGVIDFHFACTDFFAYDIAITANAWFFNEDIEFIHDRFLSFIDGYNSVRRITDQEQEMLPMLFRGAALRFLLSRCEEKISYDESSKMMPHDPNAFLKRLEFFQNEQF